MTYRVDHLYQACHQYRHVRRHRQFRLDRVRPFHRVQSHQQQQQFLVRHVHLFVRGDHLCRPSLVDRLVRLYHQHQQGLVDQFHQWHPFHRHVHWYREVRVDPFHLVVLEHLVHLEKTVIHWSKMDQSEISTQKLIKNKCQTKTEFQWVI